MRRFAPSIAWTLIAVLGCGAVFGWWIYSQRLSLHDQNRQEIAHASRDLGILLETVQAAVEHGLAADPAKTEFPLPMREFARRNPFVYWTAQDPIVTLNADAGCRDRKPGFISPARIANPKFQSNGDILQIDTSPVANFFDIPISDAAFEYLLITDAHGKVLVELKRGASSARGGQLGWIESQAWEKNDRSKDYPLVRVTELGALISPDAPQKAQQMITSASGATTVRLGDRDFYLYYHPIRARTLRIDKQAHTCDTEDTTWVVAGLADPDRMLREALLISPQWTLVLLLLLAVVVAAQPWVKLAMITSSERFRFADAALLVPSGAVALVVLALLLESSITHLHLANAASNGLEELARTVEQQLVGELKGLRDQIDTYDRAAWQKMQLSPEVRCGDLPDQPRLFSSTAIEPEKRWAPKPARGRLPFSQVGWVGHDGKQFLKATIYENSIRLDVSRRPYYLEPIARRMWTLPGGADVFVQTYRSISTAGVLESLAIHSRLTPRCGVENKPVIATVSTEPLLIEDPLLPAGYGFAVIAADGRVVFHSDKRRMLKGDLYEQISNPETLESLVVAKSPGHFETDYLRRRNEMYVTPLRTVPQAGWFVVTFRDLQVLSTISNEALIRAVTLSAIPLVIPLLGAVFVLVRGKRVLALLWPSESDAAVYRELMLVYAGILAAALLLVALAPADALLPFWLMFPVIPIAMTAALYWYRRRFVREPGPPLGRTAPFVRAGALLWVLVALVPALGISRFSVRVEMQKADEYERERAEQHIADWKARDRDRFRDLRVDAPADLNDLLETRAAHLTAFRRTALADGESDFDLLGMIDRRVPVYNDISAALRHQSATARPTVNLQSFGGYVDAEKALRWPGLPGAAALMLLLGVVYAVVRYAVRGLFLEPIAASLKTEDVRHVLARSERVLFLVRSESERLSLLRTIWRAKRVAVAAQTAGGGSQALPLPGGAVVQLGNATVIPDLEKAVSHPEAIEALEKAWWAGEPILVVSRAHPRDLLPLGADTYVGQRVPERLGGSLPIPGDVDAVRWRAVLDHLSLSLAEEGEAQSGDSSTAGLGRGAQPPETLNAWFGALWDYCSREERLTLVQAAEEGLANPHQQETVQRLVNKGLLTMRPQLTPMSADFERFLRRSAGVLQIRKWEAAEEGLGWRGSRWIFLGVLLVGAVFIAGTQETLVKAAAGMLVTAAGLVKAGQELLGLAGQKRASGSSGQ